MPRAAIECGTRERNEMKKISYIFIFIFSFATLAQHEPLTNEILTRELMTKLEMHLDKEYYKTITDKDREIAFRTLQQFQGKGKISAHPQLIMSAGAMTAGKTTTFEKFESEKLIDRDSFTIIDPDEMKALIPEYVKQSQNRDTMAGSNFHLLSMYMGDILLGWNLLQKKSSVYMTSLRYMPSGRELIERVRRDHPNFQITIIYVRSPVATLMDRNVKRHSTIGRLVPEDLLMRSVPEVENSVWHLEPLADKFMLIVNDEHRPLRISYLRHHNEVASSDINVSNLSEKDRKALFTFLNDGTPQISRQNFGLANARDDFTDIDWTSFYVVADPTLPDTIFYRGKYFRPTDGLREYMTVILNTPGLRSTFMSGGDRERNEEVLRGVKLEDGSNLFERVYKILSTKEFRSVSNDPALKWSDQFKKDLTKSVSDMKLSEAIATDDQPDATLAGEQRKSVVWLHRTFRYIDDYSKFSPTSVEHLPPHERAYYPESDHAWALERNKLAWALGVRLVAHQISNLTGLSLRQTVYSLTHDIDAKSIDREDPSQYVFYLLGTKAMNKVNPHWQKVPLPTPVLSCADRLKHFAMSQ
jgi:hypothetical protein